MNTIDKTMIKSGLLNKPKEMKYLYDAKDNVKNRKTPAPPSVNKLLEKIKNLEINLEINLKIYEKKTNQMNQYFKTTLEEAMVEERRKWSEHAGRVAVIHDQEIECEREVLMKKHNDLHKCREKIDQLTSRLNLLTSEALPIAEAGVVTAFDVEALPIAEAEAVVEGRGSKKKKKGRKKSRRRQRRRKGKKSRRRQRRRKGKKSRRRQRRCKGKKSRRRQRRR